jgi:hypothetical protein
VKNGPCCLLLAVLGGSQWLEGLLGVVIRCRFPAALAKRLVMMGKVEGKDKGKDT